MVSSKICTCAPSCVIMVISTALIGDIGDCSSCVGIRVHSRTLAVVVAGVVIVCPVACDRIRRGDIGTLRIRGLV